MTATVADVVAALDALYPPGWAEPWDAVGLVCGRPDRPVRRVHFAIDPVAAVVAEALDVDAQLVVTHHPLYLHGTTGVAATGAKGRLVHRLIEAGVALHVAHTNADVAAPGVSDALAAAFDLAEVAPLTWSGEPVDKVVTFTPAAAADRVVDAMTAAGAGRIGEYTRCAFAAPGEGTFLAGPGAQPTIGSIGQVERVAELRVEMVSPRSARTRVLRSLLAAHPYEEPAFDLYELAGSSGARGLGRVGRLAEPVPLHAFVRQAAAALPPTSWGVRAAGDPDRLLQVVAVCGGAGAELAGAAAAAGADVLVTADLRHHPASEVVEPGGLALVDAAHWATEWPWLEQAARLLTDRLAGAGASVATTVSRRVTDPWTLHAHAEEADQAP